MIRVWKTICLVLKFIVFQCVFPFFLWVLLQFYLSVYNLLWDLTGTVRFRCDFWDERVIRIVNLSSPRQLRLTKRIFRLQSFLLWLLGLGLVRLLILSGKEVHLTICLLKEIACYLPHEVIIDLLYLPLVLFNLLRRTL